MAYGRNRRKKAKSLEMLELLAGALCEDCEKKTKTRIAIAKKEGYSHAELKLQSFSGMKYPRMSNQQIAKMRMGGYTLEAIGRQAGLSRQRIEQICKAEGLALTKAVVQVMAKDIDHLIPPAKAGQPLVSAKYDGTTAGPGPGEGLDQDPEVQHLKKELDKLI